jgi:hypothetical protein
VYVQPVYLEERPTEVYVVPVPERGLGLTIAGFGLFGLSYLLTVGAGTVTIDAGRPDIGKPMLIPAVGPFIATARQDSAAAGFALALTGVVQLTGLAMGIAGAVLLGKSRAEARRLALGPGGVAIRW